MLSLRIPQFGFLPVALYCDVEVLEMYHGQKRETGLTVLVLLHLRQPQIRLVDGDAVEALAVFGDGRGVLVEEGRAGRALGLGRVGVLGDVDHGRGVRVHRGLAVDKLVEALVDAWVVGRG